MSDKEILSDEEEDVVDYTNPRHDDRVRISNGFNIEELKNGIVFNPQEEEKNNNDQNILYYRASDQEDLANLNLNDDADDEEEDDFDQLKKKMVDITPDGDGGVLKRIVKEGLYLEGRGPVPERAVVKIHYSLSLEGQDEPFDSSLLRGKAEKHRIGDGNLILGLMLGIRTMRRCEKAQFLIHHDYGFGEMGIPPRVPKRAQILATVEVMDFTEESEAEGMLGLEVEERKKKFSFTEIEKVSRLENSNGNQAVRQKDLSLALRHYERGQRLLEDVSLAGEEEERRRDHLLEKLLLNIAHCANKLHRPKKACLACKDALKIEESAKALYRFGIAKRQLEDYDASRNLLLRAQKKAPQDVNISKELRLLEDYLVQERKREAAMCKKMFSEVEKPEKKEVKSKEYTYIYEELKEFRDKEEGEIFSISEASLAVKELKVGDICSNLSVFE